MPHRGNFDNVNLGRLAGLSGLEFPHNLNA